MTTIPNPDDTTELFIKMLSDHLDSEPPKDAGGHPSAEVHEAAGRTWKQWDDARYGFELVLGARLARQAVRTYQQQED